MKTEQTVIDSNAGSNTDSASSLNKRRKRLNRNLSIKLRKSVVSRVNKISWVHRSLSLLLILTIFSTSVLGSPDSGKSNIVSFSEQKKAVEFRLATTEFGSYLQTVLPSRFFGFLFSGLRSRQQRVERIIIEPGDEKGNLTILQGQRITFVAIGLAGGRPVNGLAFKWSVEDVLRARPSRQLSNGIFEANNPGKFAIGVSAGGVQSYVNVTVLPNEGLGLQRLLQKSDESRNSKENQTLGKMRAENKLITREISSRNAYRDDEERQRNQEFKSRQNETRERQERNRQLRPDPFKVSASTENDSKSGQELAHTQTVEAGNSSTSETSDLAADRADSKSNGEVRFLKAKSRVETEPEETTEPLFFRPLEEDGWNGDNWWYADDPGNQTGTPPGTSPELGAGNGNFQFSAPVVVLPGRGLDLNLSLSYNSRLWSKTGNQMVFDADKGNPAPGWNLGFGKMVYLGANGGCMLVDADGTRRGYTGTNSTYSSGSYFSNSFTGYTADGSFIDYSCFYSSSTYGTYVSGSAKLANGTVVYYGSQSAANDQVYPTSITDPHGNYISITYRNNQGPQVSTVTDTMGRVINFNYDSLNRLISVTVPGLNGGPARTAVQLHYAALNLNYAFAGGLTTDTNNATPYVLDAIYYPGTNTGYWFGDSDSYSSYGMIAKVKEMRGMSSTGSTNDQGTVSQGTMTKQAVYDYPLTPNASLTDAPTYSNLTESWAGMDTGPATTNYLSYMNANPRTITVTQPNGAKSKQYMYNAPGSWNDGLIYMDETLDQNNNVLTKSEVTWQQGNYQTARPIVTTVTDERQQTLRSELVYGTNLYNQVTSRKEFGYNNGPLLREARTTYENGPAYTIRHIFSLVKSNEVFDGAGNRVSKTDYEYDNQTLKETPGVIMHNYTYDPYTTVTNQGPCINGQFNHSQCSFDGEWLWDGDYWVICTYECYEYEQISAFDAWTQYRGNLTKITSYADAQNANPTQSVVDIKQYDVTGNLVAETASCCEQKTYTFNISNQFAYPVGASRGSSNPGSTIRNTTSATYDFNTGLILTSTNTMGKTDNTVYNANTLRPTQNTSSTGAYSQTFYDDSAMTITSEIRESGGNLAGKSIKYLNGIGKVVRDESLGANNVYDRVDTKYTNLGQVWKQSQPYRAGDPVYENETAYDLLGRTIWAKSTDGSTSYVYHNEAARPGSASSAPGETSRQVDPWGRERWSRNDALGRMVEVVEPAPDSNGLLSNPGSLVTTYTFNTMGNLIQTQQGSQNRYFKFDTLGRLTRQKLAEQSATITDAGVFVGENGPGALWSSAVLQFDDRSNIIQAMDARGVLTNFSYQLPGSMGGGVDPLNRIQSVSFNTSANPSIEAVPTVTYEYVSTFDQDRLFKVTNGNVSDENYYDAEGRVITTTRKLINKNNFAMTTNRTYDSLNRGLTIQYPAQTGLPGSPTKVITHSYDNASRLASLSFNGQQQASGFVYNASSQTTSLNVGVAGANQVNEQFTFDPQTGLLTNQRAVRSGSEIINLSYDYTRNNSAGNTNPNWKTGAITKVINNLNNQPPSQNKNREYQYDSLGRLRFAKGGPTSNLWTQEYQYDRFGNRTVVNVSGQAADGSPMVRDGLTNLTYNQLNNRISNSGFQYDEAGNQTRAVAENGTDWHLFEYDAVNRLIKISKDNGPGNPPTLLQTQEYGIGNDRISQLDNVTNQRTYYYGSIEYAETNNNGTLLWSKSYVYLGDSVLSTITPNGSGGETVEYNHPDRLGTKVVTNQQTGTSFEQNTLPFGTALAAESSGSSAKRFTSYERSSRTGLDYAQNRTYDSKQGRFTQVDPIGMSSSSLIAPQTLNLYSYCGNDPINRTDPKGLFWGFLKKVFKWVLIAVTVVVAVMTIVTAPATLAGILGAISAGAGAASSVLNGLGFKTAGMILGIVAMGTGIGSVLAGGGSMKDLIIYNLDDEKGGKGEGINWGRLGPMSGFLSGVGAISNFAKKRDLRRKKSDEREADRVARIFHRYLNWLSIKFDREYSLGLCKIGEGKYEPTEVLEGNDHSVPVPDCKNGLLIAVFHTHGKWKQEFVVNGRDGNEEFGPSDTGVANRHNLLVYVSTPRGKLKKFIPALSSTSPYKGRSVTLKP